jgi:hypothetical protein
MRQAGLRNLTAYPPLMNRLPRLPFPLLLFAFCVIFILASCAPRLRLSPASPLPLAAFTGNGVAVSIALEQDASGRVFLAATFTPTEAGFHLYNKDLPANGINGLGRPTRLELVPASRMQAAGDLTVSLPAGQEEDLEEFMTYPEGPVTLRLAVILPAGDGWMEDQVSVTFMACSENACHPPIVGKIVSVRVPGAALISNP